MVAFFGHLSVAMDRQVQYKQFDKPKFEKEAPQVGLLLSIYGSDYARLAAASRSLRWKREKSRRAAK